MLGKTEGRRRKGQQRMRWLDSITDSMDMNLSRLGDNGEQRSLVGCSPWGREESDTTERLHFTLFIGRTDTEAENPILWLPDVKN